MLLRKTFLLAFGVCAGSVIAAGVFAFLAMIGVFPRLIGKTKTKKQVMLFETWIILGGILGNALDLLFPKERIGAGTQAVRGLVGNGPGQMVLALLGLGIGIFVGCLVMSLAETVKSVPVINRRIRLAVGIQYVVLGIALGKLCGAAFYFLEAMGA